MLLARSTGQCGSRPRRAKVWVDGSPSHNNSRRQRTLQHRACRLGHPRSMGERGLSPAPDHDVGPKQKRCLVAIREGARVPLGSLNAKTRDDDEPGRNRCRA